MLVVLAAALTMAALVRPTAAQDSQHPASRQIDQIQRTEADQASHSSPNPGNPDAPSQSVYENGPINGTVNSWGIHPNSAVSNSFTVVSGGTTISGLSFGAWMDPGDTLTTVEVSITAQPFGGTSFFDGTVTFNQIDCFLNNQDVQVCRETGTFSGPMLAAGTYWVTLTNAMSQLGGGVFWDQDSGDGCQSPGCPSLAQAMLVGTIPSESFTLLGTPGNQTTTTLAVTPNPALAGHVVSLAATVQNTGGQLVTIGTVTFLSGAEVLGTVQANDALRGLTATLKSRFAPGNYSLTAQYNRNEILLGSQSAAQVLNVTGTEPTLSTLTAIPDGRNYDFNLSVFGFGFPSLAGGADLNNLTQGGTLIGTINVAGPGIPNFQPQQTYGTGARPSGIVAADFNGDGFLDLATTNNSDNTVSVLLGNGDGTFQSPQTYATGRNPNSIVAWDFNDDGNLDLAVTNGGDGTITILLGNGDGTFQSPITIPVGHAPVGIVTADFNGDGFADLAVANSGDNTVGILLGKGNGGFQPQQTFATGPGPHGIATGDFNGDGLPDLAVTNNSSTTVSVLLGNGDGTFQPQTTYAVGNVPFGIVASDFKNDGVIDLAVVNGGDSTISVLLGNGNGTFQAQQTYPAGPSPALLATTDFNGDGIPDLAVANSSSNSVGVLLGNGDGTFQAQQSYQVGSGPFGIALADFNGDAVPDIAATNMSSNSSSVLLGGVLSIGELANIPVTGIGPQDVQTSFVPAGNLYAPSSSNVVGVQGSTQITTATQLVSSRNPSQVGQRVTFTATVTWSDGVASGDVVFQSNGLTIPECPNPVPLVSGVATCTTSSLAAGSDTILASFSDPTGRFANSSASLIQAVSDFQISITPGSLTVTQGFSNATDPFFAQTVQVTVQALSGYSNMVSLSCSVTPVLTGGSCVVSSPASGSVDANLTTTLIITAGSSTQIGPYMVVVTGQDNNGLMHDVTQNLMVINHGPGINEASGGGGSSMVYFPGTQGTPIGNFSCPLVNGTGLTGNQPLEVIGGNCAFTPSSGTIPGPVMVTISGCTVARLNRHMPIYAMFFLGLPGMVFLGPLTRVGARRRQILQVVGLLLVMYALLAALGCGGYGQLTPTGNYQVLVQGTGTDGTVYSAVVPVTVTPLK